MSEIPSNRASNPTGGFTGVYAADGFPLAVSGEMGQLDRLGERTRTTTFTVDAVLDKGLNQVRLWELERTGTLPAIQRVLDAALALLPEGLADIQAFIDEVPFQYRGAPAQPRDIGTRIRESQFQRLAALSARMKADDREPVRIASVHRAVIWHYCHDYEARRTAPAAS